MNTDTEVFDPREFLEQFRRALQVKTPETEAEMPRLLSTYSQLCEEANRRLRDCFALIQRGRYSDAVQLAEREPTLLDRCTLLDIPERDMLVSGAKLIGVKPPVLVNHDLVVAVQESYQKDTTAAGNRNVLHRLTLARAPLPARLAVMRGLLIQNPNHPFMETDIRSFERAWFQQAGPFAQSLLKEGRAELIAEMVEDLEQGGYFEKPPSSLLSQLRSLVAKSQSAQIPALAEEIRRAFEARSIEAVAQLQERWKSVVAAAGMAVDDERFGVAAAFRWLESTRENERRGDDQNAARSRLMQAIRDPGTKRLDLEIAYRTAKAAGVVDDASEQEFRSRLAALDGERRMLIVGIAIAAGFVLVSTLVGVAWTTWSRGAENSRQPPDASKNDKNGPNTSDSQNPRGADPSDLLPKRLVAFRTRMDGATGTSSTFESLAKSLRDEIAPICPDQEQARRARLAMDALSTWNKALEVQGFLESGQFLTRSLTDGNWQGQPPSRTLAAAAEYVEMLRNRDSSIRGTEAASVKERLGRIDIVNLWVIRRAGQDSRHYTKKRPAATEARDFVRVLLDSNGRDEETPFLGRRSVSRAPQSVFAERAAKLWETSDRKDWIEDLAETYDYLLDMADMDPVLKLELVRRFLNLAIRTSAGYLEILGVMQEFKEVTGRAGLITGNWLRAAEDLDKERDQATGLIKTAPHLLRLVPEVMAREKQRLEALKHGLVAAGWIYRNGEDPPMVVKFVGASPAGGSRLYTVGDRGWVDLGVVSEDGSEVRLNGAAGGYVGWPVFALFSPR